MQLSRRTWQVITLILVLLGLGCGASGLLLDAIPMEATEDMPDPAGTGFWLSRGCCLGPAFAMLFLAYIAFSIERRPGHNIHWSELLTALAVALGLLPTLLGLALVIEPGDSDPAVGRAVASLICLMPGLLIIILSGIFWALTRSTREPYQ
jgi:hypothetical protein